MMMIFGDMHSGTACLSAPCRRFGMGLALVMVGLVCGRLPAADEAGLARVWAVHRADPDAHAAVIEACRALERNSPGNPLLPVAHGLTAWHLLRLDRHAEARTMLETLLQVSPDTTPLERAGAQMARAWLSRLDRERVVVALKRHYARHVAFPETLAPLAALPPDRRPPLQDAWGQPWRYQRSGFRFLTGIENQRYTLDVATLGRRHSDLTEVLARPYALDIPYRAAQRVGRAGPAQAIAFEPFGEIDPTQPAEAAIVTPGTRFGAVTFVFMGDTLIVLASRDYWNVLATP